MRWPWSRHEDRAEASVQRSKATGQYVQDRWQRVNKATDAADEQVRINHFAASIHKALGAHR